MADPNSPFSERQSNPAGVGPFTFGVGNVPAGERAIFNLREMEKGRYVTASPKGFDTIEVTNNNTSVALRIEINEARSFGVPPNSIQSFTAEGMYRFDVWNEHDTTALSDGEATLEVAKEPLGADEQARTEATESPLRGVLNHWTGL